MEYTESQLAEFKDEYRRRRRRQWVVSGIIMVLALGVILLQDRQRGTIAGVATGVWLPVFLALVIAVLVFSFRNWRCPACGAYFGKRMRLNFCPRCGVPLR